MMWVGWRDWRKGKGKSWEGEEMTRSEEQEGWEYGKNGERGWGDGQEKEEARDGEGKKEGKDCREMGASREWIERCRRDQMSTKNNTKRSGTTHILPGWLYQDFLNQRHFSVKSGESELIFLWVQTPYNSGGLQNPCTLAVWLKQLNSKVHLTAFCCFQLHWNNTENKDAFRWIIANQWRAHCGSRKRFKIKATPCFTGGIL